MDNLFINIAHDFSRIPGARYPAEGEFSGQDFRQKILFPKIKEALEKGVKLIVSVDGTAGLGTSFLGESFGGLIQENGVAYSDIKSTLSIISNEDEEYIEEIWGYIEAAYEQKVV